MVSLFLLFFYISVLDSLHQGDVAKKEVKVMCKVFLTLLTASFIQRLVASLSNIYSIPLTNVQSIGEHPPPLYTLLTMMNVTK